MAIDAKVSFMNRMKEHLSGVLTVEQMAQVEKIGFMLLDWFDMAELIGDRWTWRACQRNWWT